MVLLNQRGIFQQLKKKLNEISLCITIPPLQHSWENGTDMQKEVCSLANRVLQVLTCRILFISTYGYFK